ncbi:MAG: metallophosphoesterase [Cyclobacteriaceae bacterium]|nr:metallophosphoesterase [Cyclobacteriaceae bacterium]UYN88374.1 MAG: metallophosphoesterase [Cyclobacteriaceae bacterium]
MRRHWIFALIVLLSCAKSPEPFKHEMNPGGTYPWTYKPVGKQTDDFSFAVIGDLHSGEREGIFEIAVEQLNLIRPDFILSVGDLVDGGTEDTVVLKQQFDHFDNRANKLKSPFFHVVGNHDITNLTMRSYWEKRYGKRYYHFIYNDVLFLVLDSEDYSESRMQEIFVARAKAIEVLEGPNPELARQMDYFKMTERATGEIGAEQSAYFEKVIADNPKVRWTFLFMHKPVWKREGDGNLSRIETALGNRNYTVINGHFHEYSHTVKNDKDYIMVATTSGGQNPLSQNAFDHITLITLDSEGPHIANLRLDGILDKTGKIPLGGDSLCFQASRCREK